MSSGGDQKVVEVVEGEVIDSKAAIGKLNHIIIRRCLALGNS